jgi:hypothetical protein
MKAGDKLWIVLKQNGLGYEVTIEHVGKQWAEPKHCRFRVNIETGCVYQGQNLVGMAYESEAAYRADQALRDAWSEFQRVVANRTADGLTVELIAQATAWLEAGT